MKKPLRIHVTSSGPRTGTTLLAEAMKTCFEIDGYCDHEAPLSKSDSSFGDCKFILTKSPSSTYRLSNILAYYTTLYVICIIRDPRDMIVSSHGRLKNQYYCDLNFWFSFIQDIKKLRSHSRFLLIKYEDLTTNPDSVQKRILEFVPSLEVKHKFSEYHLHANIGEDSLLAMKELRPIQGASVSNWLNHLSRIKEQLQTYPQLVESLVEFGYESDDSWTRILEDVEPVKFKTFKNNKQEVSRKSLFLIYVNVSFEKLGVDANKPLLIYKKMKSFFQKKKNQNRPDIMSSKIDKRC
jgi:hypothetical protein